MPFSLLPDIIFDAVTDITPEILHEYNIKTLMMDFDNTIVPYSSDTPGDDVLEWLARMQRSDIALCIVSNSKKNRVVQFCETHDLACVRNSCKPFQKGISEAILRYQFEPEHSALVGDQIFTDVLGANCGNLTSILITPIHLHNFWLKLRNRLEKPFIFAARDRKR